MSPLLLRGLSLARTYCAALAACVLGLLAIPHTAARASIEVNRGIDGVHIGDTDSQVSAVLGAPDSVTSNPLDPNHAPLWAYTTRGLWITFPAGGGATYH